METKRIARIGERPNRGKKAKRGQPRLPVQAERYFRRLSALHEVSLAIASTLNLRALIHTLLEKIDALFPYSDACVWLASGENGAFECFSCRDRDDGDGKTKGMKRDESLSLAKAAIENKAPVVVRNLQSDPRVVNSAFYRRHGLVSYLGVPMMAKGISQGAFCFMTGKGRQFTEEEIEDLTVLARQAALAIYNAQLFEQTKKQAGELRDLARHLESVREIERTRIAREIHDELGQTLTALKMDVAWLRSRSSEDQVPVQERAQAMLKLIDRTMDTVRKISTTLRPAILDDFGLFAAMQWQAEDFESRTGIQCRLSLPAEEAELDQKRATGVFRIFQETLTNIMRHANATGVNISVRNETEDLVLEVGDNGRGITESEIYDVNSLGLLGMRERALLLGGEFSIRGVKGKGTTVKVRIPHNRSRAR
jgi:signal transduction histidine kinase